jgi:PAS domain S-box-containing protein/putative nucleotidyltransferase with HDIG domain
VLDSKSDKAKTDIDILNRSNCTSLGDFSPHGQQAGDGGKIPDKLQTGQEEVLRLRKELQEARDKYEELKLYHDTLIGASYDAIVTTDRELRIIGWNKNAEALFGWQAGEVLGKQLSPQSGINILEAITREEVMRCVAESGSWCGNETVHKQDGSSENSLVNVSILWDITGKFNGMVAIYPQPVVLRIESEETADKNEIDLLVKKRTEELAKVNRLLQQDLDIYRQAEVIARESEGKNRDLVDNIELGIFRCTPGARGRFLEVNRAMENITGYSREELLQMDVSRLYANIRPDSRIDNEINIGDWKVTHEIELKKKDGSEIEVARTIVAIRYESGAIQFFDGILENITEQKQARQQIQQSLERLQKTIKEIIQAMAYIGEVRDPYTAGHQRRVAQLSDKIARTMGLADEKHEGLTMAAFVHDIGKIIVPSDILSKPGKLTKPEFDMLKDHTRIGYEILKNIEFPWPIANIVLQHHERMNGSGYPSNLSGDQIIIEARILAVADVVEAMSSHRPYRPALGIDKALEEIDQNSGILYDTNVVNACIKLFTDKGFSLS